MKMKKKRPSPSHLPSLGLLRLPGPFPSILLSLSLVLRSLHKRRGEASQRSLQAQQEEPRQRWCTSRIGTTSRNAPSCSSAPTLSLYPLPLSCYLTSSSSPVLAFSLCALWLRFKDIEVSCCLSWFVELTGAWICVLFRRGMWWSTGIATASLCSRSPMIKWYVVWTPWSSFWCPSLSNWKANLYSAGGFLVFWPVVQCICEFCE